MTDSNSDDNKVYVGFGCLTPGSVIAAILSWATNHSILWMLLHMMCSWFYVLYWIIFRSNLIDYVEKLVK